MKHIIIFFFLLFSSALYSQYSLPLRLVNSDGTPKTGEAGNIQFTRYPHSYPADVVSGITVTEIGTAGNYRCRGFINFEHVKLWLSGIEQTWFDSVQVGNLGSYISGILGNYITKNTTQTGITGNKVLEGDWTWIDGTVTLNDPYIFSSSPKYPYNPSSGNLIWRSYADSMYFSKNWGYYSGGLLYFNQKIRRPYLSQALFDVNTSHFSWNASTGLNLSRPVTDSMGMTKHTIRYDSADGSENVYSKTYTEFIDRFKGGVSDSFDVKVRYQRFTNGSEISTNIFQKYNTAYSKSGENYVALISSDQKVDTIILPKIGLYQITTVVTANFTEATGSAADTIMVSLDDAQLPGGGRITTNLSTLLYNVSETRGGAQSIVLTAIYYNGYQNGVYNVMAKCFSSINNLIHEVWRTQTTAILIN